ncbi:MAG: hypothetical protein IKV94_04565 [Clostridia bacterium]|nr:hypothetical protein [Clostridia bacterium]
MKKSSFLDFVIKNRYVIICVSVVLIVAFLGWIPKLIEIGVTVGLVLLAIYLGKRIQEDENYISRTIEKRTNEFEQKKDNEKE